MNRQVEPAEPGLRPRRGWWRPWRIVALAMAAVVVAAIGFAVWVLWDLPRIDLNKPPSERAAIILEAADGSPIARNGGHYSGPLQREELPKHLVEAVLAIEDRRFYDHRGLDPFSVGRAALRNFQAGGIVQGGSTITQQLAKILFLDPQKTYRRKLQEAVIATWLDMRFAKDEILVKYLDSVYLGAGATGLNAAAEVYFDRDVADLDLAQSAMLAGLIRAPSRLNPIAEPEAARERATLVLQSMVEAGFIAREQAIAAALDPAAPVRSAALKPTGTWFGDWVHGEASAALGTLGGAARIRTTLQPTLQALGEQVVRAALEREGGKQKVDQAALVAMRHDGAVLAMVGGRSYEASQFNRAVDARRQAGSAFKTFVYMAALKAGMGPESIIIDEPIDLDGWRPQNYTGRYYGEVTLTQAFARSLNAATVRLAADIGIDSVIATARDLGIDAELEPNLTLALGTAGIGLTDLTGAYASIVSGRAPVQPWGIAGVSTEAGGEPVMFERDRSHAERVPQAGAMVGMLAAVVSEGTGKRAAIDGFAAGKTGTSQDHRDGWFVGFTDQLVVGVWVGNDDNSPTDEVTGGGLPAEIWREFVSRATGIAPLELAPEEDDLLDGPPVAEEGAETERDFAAEEEPSPPAEEEVVTIAEEPEAEAPIEAEEASTEAPAETADVPEEAPAEAAVAEAAEDPAPQEEAVAEAPEEPEPVPAEPAAADEELARNRALAEQLAAERRAGRGSSDGPTILLGGRGLP